METDYISREAATQAKPEFLNENNENKENALYAKGWNACNSAFIDNLLDIPAADVRPVKEGHWLTWEEMFPDQNPRRKNNLGVFCSACKKHADNMTDYCPNCGAMMGGTP